MANKQLNLQNNPLKLYIQDIFRAQKSSENKYMFELFGLYFKNIMIHGVVTSIYNKNATFTNLELSDPTATVQVFFDSQKSNRTISTDVMKGLCSDFADIRMLGDPNLDIMNKMMNSLTYKTQNPINFNVGSYLSVVGDISLDDMRETRTVSAYECKESSVNGDILWLEELRWLYEKFYLWIKE